MGNATKAHSDGTSRSPSSLPATHYDFLYLLQAAALLFWLKDSLFDLNPCNGPHWLPCSLTCPVNLSIPAGMTFPQWKSHLWLPCSGTQGHVGLHRPWWPALAPALAMPAACTSGPCTTLWSRTSHTPPFPSVSDASVNHFPSWLGSHLMVTANDLHPCLHHPVCRLAVTWVLLSASWC